jgi:hypothetical protein
MSRATRPSESRPFGELTASMPVREKRPRSKIRPQREMDSNFRFRASGDTPQRPRGEAASHREPVATSERSSLRATLMMAPSVSFSRNWRERWTDPRTGRGAYRGMVTGPGDAMLVGACFGGWIAAEMMVRSTTRFSNLVLVDPLGTKPPKCASSDFAAGSHRLAGWRRTAAFLRVRNRAGFRPRRQSSARGACGDGRNSAAQPLPLRELVPAG